MNSKEHNRPVALEDLLRLKRAERPSPAFWTKFESELRAKQLAAIVEKGPWWRRLTAALVARRRFALTASAVAAMSLFVVRSNHFGPELVMVIAQTDSSSVDVDGSGVEGAVVDSSQRDPLENFIASAAPEMAVSASDADYPQGAAPFVAVHPESSEGIAQAASLSPADEDVIPDALSPVAQSIANNLAAVKEAHPELSDRFFAASGFDLKSLMPNRPVVDPLSQMRSPADVNRARLLASARLISVTPSTHNSERMARRISDERLTEEGMRRFGARGNELSLKF